MEELIEQKRSASTRSVTRKSGRAVPTSGGSKGSNRSSQRSESQYADGFTAPNSTRTLIPSSHPPTAPTFNFELPHGTQHPLLFHLSVCGIADRIQQIDLRTLVETKIEEVAARSWSDLEFMEAVKIVYEISPPGHHGDKLRTIVVKVAARHGKALYTSEPFKRLIRQVREFSADLNEALCGQMSTHPNQQMFHCPSATCAHSFSTELPVGQQELSCPVFFVKADLDFWLPS